MSWDDLVGNTQQFMNCDYLNELLLYGILVF